MATVHSENLEAARREPYIGEKRRFMRDGYGSYVYENAFFRYEGEWMKGKKHGHGKLLMKDGTYYEGQFVNGEINGNGYKYFSSSKSKYSGQFLNGEMHGHGIMYYRNGHIYEGQWYKNKKQGFGILRTSDKAVFEGTFHGHVRDGEGTQTYDNGDRYEGFWVLDQRQGHGDLFMADGSHYSGQFFDDMFNGEGLMKHASGIVYSGNWVNGFPITMATKIKLFAEESPLIIRQGLPFAIRVECHNDEDQVVPDQGRELQVSAGFKYRAPKMGSALFDVIEDVEDQPIPTPFGYDVVLYPITDQLSEVDVPVEETDSKMSTMKIEDEGEEKGEDEGGEDEAALQEEQITENKEVTETELEMQQDAVAGSVEGGAGASALDPGMFLDEAVSQPLTPVEMPIEEEKSSKGKEESSTMPLPAPTQTTVSGACEWNNLQLAPAPPMYRPFVIMEEEAGPKKKTKAALIREKIDGEEGEHDEEGEHAETEGLNGAENEGVDLAELEPKGSQPQAEEIEELTAIGLMEEVMDELDDAERKNSQIIAQGGHQSKTQLEPEKPTASDEKVARTGEYILMVTDVTNPPFLGRRLDPAFLMLKLKKPKKVIVRKPKYSLPIIEPPRRRSRTSSVNETSHSTSSEKSNLGYNENPGIEWDTQRHIAMAMSRANAD